jgi:putative ABC transport system permease protein
VFGIGARIGRVFVAGDHRDGAPPVCVISDSFWSREYQSDPGVLRQTIVLDGVSYSIVGVLQPDTPNFSYPGRTDVYLPLEPRAPYRERGTNYLSVVGRLHRGIPLVTARAEIETIQSGINAEFPGNRHGMTLRPLMQVLFANTQRTLWVLLAAAGVIILIACANLANLLLARGAERAREIAVRQAFGADRGQILRRLLSEGLLLPAIGGTLGVALAIFGGEFLIAVAPGGMRLPERIELDWAMAAFSLGLILLVTLISGLAPAIRGSRIQLNAVLRAGAHHLTGSSRSMAARYRFVTAEIALATILLTGSFLTVESLWRLVHSDPGFDPSKLLTMQILLATNRYANPNQQTEFFERVLRELRALPGVLAAGAITDLPIGDGATTGDFVIQGRAKPANGKEIFARKEIVTPDYFQTMKISLIAGRSFTDQDRANGPKVAIISQGMAKQFWPSENPIGRRLDLGLGKQNEWEEIVGVVGDVKAEGLDMAPAMTGYLCASQYPSSAMTVVVRTVIDPLSLAAPARSAVFSIDRQQPITDLSSMRQILRRSASEPTSITYLLSAFAGIALLLAGLGVYGLVTYSVALRTREIGIRMALGAGRGAVLRSILSSGMKLLMIGLGIGLTAGAGLMQLLRDLLFGVSAVDPLALLSVGVTMALSSLLACYLPARRAACVDPIRALRNE